MAVPCSFDEANVVLDKPDDMTYDDCEALSCLRGVTEGGMHVVVSCWKLTTEELEELNRTGRVWLVVAGTTQAPMMISGTKPRIIQASDG